METSVAAGLPEKPLIADPQRLYALLCKPDVPGRVIRFEFRYFGLDALEVIQWFPWRPHPFDLGSIGSDMPKAGLLRLDQGHRLGKLVLTRQVQVEHTTGGFPRRLKRTG